MHRSVFARFQFERIYGLVIHITQLDRCLSADSGLEFSRFYVFINKDRLEEYSLSGPVYGPVSKKIGRRLDPFPRFFRFTAIRVVPINTRGVKIAAQGEVQAVIRLPVC